MAKSRKKKKKKPGGPVGKNTAVTTMAAAAKIEKKTVAKTSKKRTPARTEAKGPNIIAKTVQFFREVRIELLKVNWPSRKETMASTTIILALVVIVSLYLSLVDFGVRRLINFILG